MDKPTLSVNIIAKNEAATIRRAIECVKGVADEIVIGVDRTSTDDTLVIAHELGNIVYEFDFNDNFGAVRNYSMGKCNMEWILILDAHEYVTPDNVEKMKRIWELIPDGSTGIGIKLMMENDSSGVQMRFLKNNVGWRWYGAVHNQLNKSEVDQTDINMGFTDLVIEHLPTKENRKKRHKQRRDMIFRHFTAELKDKPKDVRSIFYLSQYWHEDNKFKKALGLYKKYLEYSADTPNGLERYFVTWQKGRAQQALGYSDAAIQTMDECINMRWDLPLAYAAKGEILHIRAKKLSKDYNKKRAEGGEILRAPRDDFDRLVGEVEHLFKTAIKVMEFGIPDSSVFYPLGFFTWLPWWKLADLYDDIGWYEQAIMCATKVQSYNNLPPIHRKDMDRAVPIWQQELKGDLILNDEDVVKGAIKDGGIEIKKGKPKLVVFDNFGSFTTDIIEHFHKDGYTAVRNPEFVAGLAWWANVVWYDFCDENIVHGSMQEAIEAQVIVRVHGFEAYGGSLAKDVNWGYVDDIVFVANHKKDQFLSNYPEANECRHHVIYNGVDLDKWTYKKRSGGTVLGYAGYLKGGKNPSMLLDILGGLPKNFTLKVAGTWQNEQEKEHFDYIVNQYYQHRVIFEEWQEDMDKWLDGIDYLISSSISESFSYVVAEAMAKGIRVLVYDRPDARLFWSNELVFKDEKQAIDKIINGEYRSSAYRDWIAKHYSLDKQMKQIAVLMKLGKRGNTKPKNPVRELEVQHDNKSAIHGK